MCIKPDDASTEKKPPLDVAMVEMLIESRCPADIRVLTEALGKGHIPPARRNEVADAITDARELLAGVVAEEAATVVKGLRETAEDNGEAGADDDPETEAAETGARTAGEPGDEPVSGPVVKADPPADDPPVEEQQPGADDKPESEENPGGEDGGGGGE